MTSPPHSSLLFDDPGELIAAIPGLLTFHPADSVVLITYTGLRRLGLESVLRMDIPRPEHIADVAEQLLVVAMNHEAVLVDLVVLGGDGADPPARLPARELVERLADELDKADIGLSHAVWAPGVEAGRSWWCYEDPTCTGQIRDPRASPLTASLTPAGAVTFGSRDELAALLTPDPDDVLAHRAELIAARAPTDVQDEFQFVKDTLDTITGRIHTDPHNPVPALDDPTIARLAAALSTPDIREACLAFTMTMRAPAAELLWTVLTRATPAPARADPASLLGVTCYLRGDGARAALALDAALAANPDHRLTHTLRHVLDNGLPPRHFRTLLAQSFVAAFANR
jgi:uncharacterized protein DUF4192